MLGESPQAIGPDTPCPTCRILDGGPFQDSQYPYPDCPCPEGFEKQPVEITNPDGQIISSYRFCKPTNGSCLGKTKGSVSPPIIPPDEPEPEQSGPNWFLILGGIGVAGLLYHRYKSLR